MRVAGILVVLLLLAGCTVTRPVAVDCDRLTAADLRGQIGQPTSGSKLQAWVAQSFGLPASAVQVDTLQPGQLETVEWQSGNVKYRSTVQGGELTDTVLSYNTPRPTAAQILGCLGAPDRYWASYKQTVEAKELSLDLLFAAKGALAYGANIGSFNQQQRPALDETLPIFGLVFVPSGSVEQVIQGIYGGQSQQLSDQMLRDARPWPGDWQDLQIAGEGGPGD